MDRTMCRMGVLNCFAPGPRNRIGAKAGGSTRNGPAERSGHSGFNSTGSDFPHAGFHRFNRSGDRSFFHFRLLTMAKALLVHGPALLHAVVFPTLPVGLGDHAVAIAIVVFDKLAGACAVFLSRHGQIAI